MAKFYAVRDRDDGELYAVMVMTDQARPGLTHAYRWIPNFKEWVIDRGLKRDLRSFPGDQLNEFTEIDPKRAADLVRELPKITTRWVVDSYKGETERLASAALGLPVDDVSARPTTDPHMVDSVRKARPGTWVPVRVFPAEKGAAARKWASEIRLGAKARLASLGPLDARVVPSGEGLEVHVRRAVTSSAVVQVAQRIAEAAHASQLDKAGRPYIDHPRRVATRLTATGAPAEAIAAGWLHDVLEDTDTTAQDLSAVGVPPETIAAVQAVTKRSGETAEDYAVRIASTPLAVEVKRADLADNSDVHRLALLDDATRIRLTKKYTQMRALLDSHDKIAPH